MPNATDTTVPVQMDSISVMQLRPEDVALRAFELYERRGSTDGADLDDWLEAERQLLSERQARLVGV